MSNMHDCLQRMIDFGEIDKARGQDAQGQYDQLFKRYRTIMGEAQAHAAAAKDLKEATAKATRARYHKVVNQLQAMRRIKNLIETSRDPAVALRNLLEYSEGSGFKGESVRSLGEAYEASINHGLREALQATGLNVVGSSRNKTLLDKVIRELHDEATGDPLAKRMAEAVRGQQQRMRRAFNAHGGDIGDLSDFGVTHSHNVALIRKAGFDAWATAIERGLAWNRIPDLATGRMFADSPGKVPPRAQSERFLRDVYDGITARGWDDRDPSLSMGGKALYNQRAEKRVLHFANGSAWIEYNKAFGSSDPFTAMMNGLHGMATDVAMMRVLGPNPKQGLAFAEQVARKRASELRDPNLEARVATQGSVSKAMLAHMDGSVNVPERLAMATFFAGTRAVLTSVQLGSAVLSSVTDVATITMASHAMGMNARNVLGTSVKLMASHATRESAARMGYVAQSLADAGGGASRYFGEMFGNGIPERLAGFTLRASGLTFVTDMRKVAFQMEFSGHLADNAARGFDEIDTPLRKLFTDRGITSRDWDALRDPAARFRADNGADFIAPSHWLEVQTAMPRVEAEGLAMRLQMAIQEQLEFAVPTASVEGKALLQGESRAGSFSGELLRSSTAYKSFTMSLMFGQYRRFVNLPSTMDKVKYAGTMSTMLIIMGALAIQMKELAKGNDPRPMNTGKFWMAALFQGGGLGIFGDFFQAEASRTGGGLGETLAGPVVGLAGDILGPIASNLTALVKGEKTSVGRDVAGLVRQNTPVASSLWYMRAAYSNIVADNLTSFLDPGADMAFRRQMQRMQKDYGTQSFIGRGGTSIRAPDLSNALPP